MIETTFDEIEKQLKNHSLHYFNFYNTDIKAVTQQITKYYQTHSHDQITTDQELNAIYLDIEVFTEDKGLSEHDTDNGTFPVNIVTIISSTDNIIHTYLLLFDSNFENFGLSLNMSAEEYQQFIENRQNYYIEELKKRKYIDNEYIRGDYVLQLHIYKDEKQLHIDLWKKIHEYDPDILTSWNGDNFDYYYLYNRYCTLFGEENVDKLLSKFGKVYLKNKRVQFFEYTVTDLLYMYRPRDEAGGGSIIPSI